MLKIILISATVVLDQASLYLAAKDSDNVGADDELAKILSAASAGIRDYLAKSTAPTA